MVKRVEEMSGIIVSGDVDKLLTLLQDPLVGLCNVDKKNKSIYLKMMASLIDAKGGVSTVSAYRLSVCLAMHIIDVT